MTNFPLKIITIIFIFGCGTIEDPKFDGITCEENCINFNGVVSNVNNHNDKIQTSVQLNYRPGGGFNPTDVLSVVDTDESGNYNINVQIDSSQLRYGYFELVTKPEGYRLLDYYGQKLINDLDTSSFNTSQINNFELIRNASIKFNVNVQNSEFEKLNLKLIIRGEDIQRVFIANDELVSDTTFVLSCGAEQFNTIEYIEIVNGIAATIIDSIYLDVDELADYSIVIN